MSQNKYTTAVLADSPVAFYKLNDASGTLVDSSGNGNDLNSGTGIGSNYQQGAPFSGAQSIKLTNGSQKSRPVFNTATDNITLEFWVNIPVATAAVDFVFNGTSYYVGASHITFVLRGVTSVNLSVGPQAVFSGWHHFAMIRRSGTWEYYFNGDLWLANAGTSAPTTPTGSFELKCPVAAEVYLSNVAFYGTALSATRIRAHYEAAIDYPQPPTNTYAQEVLSDSPIAYYKLDEASGLPQDSSGNGNHITSISGTPTYQQSGPFSSSYGIKLQNRGASADDGFERNVFSTQIDNISLEFWFNIVTPSSASFAIYMVNNGSSGQIGLNSPITGSVGEYKMSGPSVASLSDIGNGPQYGWRHIVLTRTSGQWLSYIDGSLAKTGGTTDPSSISGLFSIAWSSVFQVNSTGQSVLLSNISYYNTALSATRIRAHYDAAMRYTQKIWTPVRSGITF